MSSHRQAGLGEPVGPGGRQVSAARLHLRSQGRRPVHTGQGRGDLPRRQGRSWEAPGGHAAGAGDEGGSNGTVDGWAPGARLGQERPLPWPVERQSAKLSSDMQYWVHSL